MSAFLFTGWVSQFHKGHLADSCTNLIVYGGDSDACWKAFEEGLLRSDSVEEAAPTKVEKTVAAPVLDQLITEEGLAPLDWPALIEEAARLLESAAPDEFGQGYWVDADQCVPPGPQPADVDSLRRSLPEDISSGLDWEPGRMHLFLLSVLSPSKSAVDPFDDPDYSPDAAEPDDGEPNLTFAQRAAQFPELVDKELAVVIRARNAVVASWLWRKHAVGTPLESNAIRIGAFCEALPLAPA